MMTAWRAIFWLCTVAFASSDPYMAESKAQLDLETALSRFLPREQFLVQVDAQVATRTERRPLEGETVELRTETRSPASKSTPPVPLPGFYAEPTIPEADAPPPAPPAPVRQVYRYVETPYLSLLRVHVTLDEAIPEALSAKARQLVQQYLRAGYANKASVFFSKVPMRSETPREVKKPEPEPPPRAPASFAPPAPTDEERLWSYARWLNLFLLALVAMLLWRLGGILRKRPRLAAALPAPAPAANYAPVRETPAPPPPPAPAPVAAELPKKETGGGVVNLLRRQLMEKLLLRSDSFRLYYDRLLDTERKELCTLLKGPAFDAMLDNLKLEKSFVDDTFKIDAPEDRLRFHDKSFEEFVAEEEWQNGQLFGFLHQLTDEQLTSLATHESPLAVSLMLRFLKADDCAFVLESLPPERRREVMKEAARIPETPLATIAETEQKMRASVRRMPAHLFGAKQKDVEFWGEVLSEAAEQETLLDDIENTRPDIYPNLKKYKFRLEEIGSIPADVARRVLSDADNETIGLALSVCPPSIADSVLSMISPKRALALKNQLVAFRGQPPERGAAAKSALTKKLREAMG